MGNVLDFIRHSLIHTRAVEKKMWQDLKAGNAEQMLDRTLRSRTRQCVLISGPVHPHTL